jgi:hypothetical protein
MRFWYKMARSHSGTMLDAIVLNNVVWMSFQTRTGTVPRSFELTSQATKNPIDNFITIDRQTFQIHKIHGDIVAVK